MFLKLLLIYLKILFKRLFVFKKNILENNSFCYYSISEDDYYLKIKIKR